MRPFKTFVCGVAVCAAVLVRAQAPQSLPKFRAGVDVVELDVSVFDKDHHPIKGLTAADFTLLEDKQPRPLVAFSEVDIPEPPPPTAAWMRDARDDIATNEVSDKRLFLILVDDASFGDRMEIMMQAGREKLKQAVRAFINRLGPSDLAALVFTGDNRRSQDFTPDHGRLLAALEQSSGGTQMPGELQIRYSVEVVRRAADYIIGAPGRRKAFVDFTDFDMDMAFKRCRPPVDLEPEPFCIARNYARDQTKLIFESAQRAGVNVYPMRLGERMNLGNASTSDPDAIGPDARWLTSVAHETAGQVFLGVADPKVADKAAASIFEAMSQYYMLGYSSSDIDKFHFIKVLVDRPDAIVRTRDKYYAPLHEKPEDGPVSATVESMSGLLPKSDIPLRVTAAAFAPVAERPHLGFAPPSPSVPASAAASIAVVLGLRQLRAAGSSRAFRETLDLRVATFTAEGEARGSSSRQIPLTLPAGTNDLDYEMLTRVDIPKPGLYELRLSAHSAARNADGAVYITVDVPDFAKAPLSLSGIVVGAAGDLVVDGQDSLEALLPVTPTAVRVFGQNDLATAFLRVYQSGTAKPVDVHLRIVDDHDRAVLDRHDTVAADRFGAAHSAAISVPLPLSTLPVGAYLLSIDAAAAKITARRELRFTVR